MSINGRPVPTKTAATLSVTGASTSGNGLTVTLPSAGSGIFHYITRIQITAATTAVALGVVAFATVTTTNLPGSPTYIMEIDRALGAKDTENDPRTESFRSSIDNTATTIVCPATANCAWSVNVEYYTGT